MTDLYLHGRSIHTVFELLGYKENDITYSIGWALAQSDAFLQMLLADLFPGLPIGEEPTVLLQESHAKGGYTDIELQTDKLHVIVEAKRGWAVPGESQLAKYLPRFQPDDRHHAFLVVAEGNEDFARHSGKLPSEFHSIPVGYRSWKQINQMARKSRAAGTHAEKRLIDELCRYMEGLMSMQNQRSNLVYVVSLGANTPTWSSISWRAFVEQKKVYFHPIGPHGGWPKEPVNYLAFRYDSQLQSIHHVESYEVWADLSEALKEIDGDKWRASPETFLPHYLYHLGPAIKPPKTVGSGGVIRSMRIWSTLDLLLTSSTISEARDETKKRIPQ
jgi:hypothetical protein